MALTNEELQKIVQLVVEAMKVNSVGVDDLETVTSLSGLSSLPARKGQTVVLAPISLLAKPANDAALAATQAAFNASRAAQDAQDAATTATQAAGDATNAADTVNEIVNEFNLIVMDTKSIVVIDDIAMTAIVQQMSTASKLGQVVYVKQGKNNAGDANARPMIAYKVGSDYFSNWTGREAYCDLNNTPRADKGFLCKGDFYIWNDAKKELVRQLNVYDLLAQSNDDPFYNITKKQPLQDGYYTFETAIKAVPEDIRKTGLVLTYQMDASSWETKQYQPASLDAWEVADSWTDFGSGGGGHFINVTAEFPLQAGNYTLASAIAAIPDKRRALGTVITFAKSQDTWETRQYVGTSLDITAWNTVDLWVASGGDGKVKSVSVNGGNKQQPDSEGNIDLSVDEITIDETLDENSSNPVENRVITVKLKEVDAGTVFSSDVEIDEENNEVTVTLYNKSNAPITQFTIPAGSGSGGETETSRIILNATVDKNIIKDGDNVLLYYTYDHQNVGGDNPGASTGAKAIVEITMRRGSTTVYSQTIQDVSPGSYTLDVSRYLMLGTTDIYVRATVTDAEGKTKSKQAYQSVRVLNLSLSSSYNLSTNISGYQAGDIVTIPFAVTGTGDKIVTLYVDGVQKDNRTVTRSGTTNGSFTISMATLSTGRHTIQLVAEMEASTELNIRSESIYFDILRRGSEENVRFIGTKLIFPDGRIFEAPEHLTPRLEAKQYESISFDFVAYDSQNNPTPMDIYRDGEKSQTVTVPRTTQVYTNRFQAEGEIAMKFVCGAVEYPFYIEVAASEIDIEEVKPGMVLKLLAAGRSNSEDNPGTWEYENIKTVFNNFDWSSNGWNGDVLRLTNGANIEIGFKPFASDPTASGGTYMVELTCSNVSDRTAVVLDCMYNNMGFEVTTQQARMASMGGVSLNTLFADELSLQIAFVIKNKDNHRLMELFVNGIRCGAAQYAPDDSFLQPVPATVKINSDYADVDIRSIRMYNRALSDDEILTNYIVDRPTGEEMVLLFQNNDVETEDGSSIDIDKLRAKGKSVMRIVGDVNLVNQTNNKKFEVPADVYFYSAHGKDYDFIARQIGLRIQGTSSTTYPRKNYRLYFNRISKYPGCSLEVGGVNMPSFKYAFKPGARPIDIFCMKADFAESSSTHNTGVARLINDVWKKMGYLTPPQAAYKGAYDVRTTVDGFPCDVWADNDGTNTNLYLGKYNFNNEKSASGIIYGFEGIEGFNDAATLSGSRNKCMCLEFLNNSEPLCLFRIEGTDFDTYAASKFDDALEFRFPEDTLWADAHADSKAAIKRLWTWIIACKDDPVKFAGEVSDYFNINNLSAWYLFTDYFMATDQRAKNMMLVTWDEQIWYFIPYDSDTILGVRNDGVLKYDYTIDHNSFDESIQSWAFAGHDSILWNLVRDGLSSKLAEVAGVFRSNMSTSDVLEMFNMKQMANWSERVYNKDGEFKYIQPLTDGVQMPDGLQYYNYLYSLQGSRYAQRTFTIRNRFALLDAKYVAGTYRSDSFTAYFGWNFATDNRKVKIMASEKFYFGYGFTSGNPTVSAVPAEAAGDPVELTLFQNLIVNDPQNFYGASRVAELDLRDVSMALVQTLNLNNCRALKKLDASCVNTQTALNNILVTNCKGLEEINISGLKSPNFTAIDITQNSRLRKLNAGNTALTGVSFAPGAPLEQAILPATLLSLEMPSLRKITLQGLIFERAANVTRLVAENCDLLDWQALLNVCYGVKYLRVTGVEMTGDASFLEKYMNIGGVDESGSNTTTCRLVGNYQLSSFVEEGKLAEYREHYPELNIRQSEYTTIEFDDTVSDPANISNPDNKTGYKFGNDYKPSGHISKILSLRHRVLGKKSAEGVVHIFPLHDSNSNYYADSNYLDSASPANLTGIEGSVYVYEPHYWYKGVNDIRVGKKYSIYSSNETVKKPEGLKVNMADTALVTGFGLRVTQSTLDAAKQSAGTMAYGIVDLQGYKRVRVPGVSSSVYGALFLDASDNVVGSFTGSSENGMMDGMYIFADVPEGASKIAFTVNSQIENDFVWLTNSLNIADIEPDWVEHKECLLAVYPASAEDGILRSKSGVVPSTNVSISETDAYVGNMGAGFTKIDWSMHCEIANLFFAKYGTRDTQNIGYGPNTEFPERAINGLSNHTGMTDTTRPLSTNNELGSMFNGVNIHASNCLGYENLSGRIYEIIVGAKRNFQDNTWSVEAYGEAKKVLGLTVIQSGNVWVTKMRHQKNMDLIPVGAVAGSGSTYYSDAQNFTSNNRYLCRSCRQMHYMSETVYRYGLTYLDEQYLASLEAKHTYVGTRHGFRGSIKWADSVEQFKNIQKLD